jgi:hypothetical protein
VQLIPKTPGLFTCLNSSTSSASATGKFIQALSPPEVNHPTLFVIDVLASQKMQLLALLLLPSLEMVPMPSEKASLCVCRAVEICRG